MKEYELRIQIMQRTDLTPSDKLVLFGALLCVDWSSLAGHVSVDEMSALTGLSPRQVKRSYKRLTEGGFISRSAEYMPSIKKHKISSIKISGDKLAPTPSVSGDKLAPYTITNNNNNNKSNENGDLKIDWSKFKHLSKAEYDNLPPEGQRAYQAKAIMCSGWGAWQYDEFLEEFNSTMESRQ